MLIARIILLRSLKVQESCNRMRYITFIKSYIIYTSDKSVCEDDMMSNYCFVLFFIKDDGVLRIAEV